MTALRPDLRRAFDRAERLVGVPLESAVRTHEFADALVISFRVHRFLLRVCERQTRTLLHLVNLPARTDIERLNRQVGALRNEVRDLSMRLEQR
jgi:hypothetical protein